MSTPAIKSLLGRQIFKYYNIIYSRIYSCVNKEVYNNTSFRIALLLDDQILNPVLIHIKRKLVEI